MSSLDADLGDIDLTFRPRSYFWPLSLETHLLSRVKGAERRTTLKHAIDSGCSESLPEYLVRSSLDEASRKALGRLHSTFMGGEYLPDLLGNEVMIARITIASTTQDVTCVYARRTKHRIQYRVVDEYEGDTLSGHTRRTSVRPLTLGELIVFFDRAWSLLDVLEMNYANDMALDEAENFVASVDSDFYPGFNAVYRRRILAWVAARRAELPTDEEDDDQRRAVAEEEGERA